MRAGAFYIGGRVSFINGATVDDATGRVQLYGGDPRDPVISNMGPFEYDDRGFICITENGVNSIADFFSNGFRIAGLADYPANDGFLRVAVNGTIASWHNGLPFTADGQLAIDTAGAVAGHVHGWPVTSAGRVCVNIETQVSQLLGSFSSGFSDGFD